MQTGMADYAHKAATTDALYIETVDEYNLYCHYVAGLVGEGLTRIWSASGKEADWLGNQLELSNSMGTLLQKTNIIRDFREDANERRFFWPREIWGRDTYGAAAGGRQGFREMHELYAPGNEKQAQWVQSGMVVDVLAHACDALDYLRLLTKQSVFCFCAIPQTMAMATLTLCFMNPDMFQKHIKIRKAEAASVRGFPCYPSTPSYNRASHSSSCAPQTPETSPTSSATTPVKSTPAHCRQTPASSDCPSRAVRYASPLPLAPLFHHTNAPTQIEQWCERHYPSFVRVGHVSGQIMFDPTDMRSKVAEADQARDRAVAREKRLAEVRAGAVVRPVDGPGAQEGTSFGEMIMYVGTAFLLVIGISLGAAWLMMQYFGDK